MTGANSAVGLRSMPVRYLFLDEVDAYPLDVEGEGDAISLAEARTRTFARRKIFIVSTPTIAGASAIEREYEASDQRRYFVPCPHCSHRQWLRFEQLRWEKGRPETAAYVCESCETAIAEHHKTWMLEHGEWRATAEGAGKTAGFHLSSLYSPLGWRAWREIAAAWEAAVSKESGSAAAIKTFKNTELGETWVEEGEAPDWQRLLERREDYAIGTIPAGGLLLTAGADVQKDRIEVSVWAFGRGKEAWLIEHRVLMGDTARDAVWKALGGMLAETWTHASGAAMPLARLALDTGFATQEAYAFVRACRCPNTPQNGTPPGWPGGHSHDRDFHDRPRAASSLAPARSHRAGGLHRRRPRCFGLGGVRAAAAAPDLQPVRQRGGRLVSRAAARPSGGLAATSFVRGQHRPDPIACRRCRARCAARLPAGPRAVAQTCRRGRAATRLHRRRAGTHRRRAGGRRAACRPAGPAAAILAALPPPRTGRAVPVERDESGLVRQPLFRPGQRVRRDRRRASGVDGDTPMMAADSLHVAVPLIVPSGMSFRLLPPCRRACSAGAFAPHFALPSAQPSNVQASCLERARPAAVPAFAGALAARAAAPRGRRCPERQRGAKAEGKTKGRGTGPRRKPVCTWGWRSTTRLRRRAACGAKPAPMQACPRASHDRTRQSLQGAQP
jgi:hypothetical protein